MYETNSQSAAGSAILSFRNVPGLPLDAARMLDALFPGVDPKAIHVLSVPGDPGTSKYWKGGRLGMGYQLNPDENLFFSIAEFSPDSRSRVNDLVVRHHLVVLDDVGVKVPRDRVDGLRPEGLLPTAIVETSPGSYQYFFKLDHPVDATAESRDLQLLQAVRARLSQGDWGDAAVQDPARYMRLPGGINGKSKYGTPSPRVRLIELNEGN